MLATQAPMKRKNHFLLSLLGPSPLLTEVCNKSYFEPFLKDLKEYTPYSSVFLYKVSRKEAPTYYDVIKHPMDLGTMTKNLPFYDTQNFYEDLDLIWNNCLYFNKDSPFFTNCAEKMRAKAESLKEFYFGEENGSFENFKDLGGVYKNDTSPGSSTVSAAKKSAKAPRIRSSIFLREMVKVFTAKALKDAGFECCSKNALGVLGDVFIFHLIKRIPLFVKKDV